MKIAGWNIAEAFANRQPQACIRFENWRKHVSDAQWKKPADVWRTFNSASYIPGKDVWVFNIGSDRLITIVDFRLDIVIIKAIMQHNEYMKWSNKNDTGRS